MCLTEVKRGQRVRIARIEDETIRTQLIRLGIGEGSLLSCSEKIPFGPLMLRHRCQEIAVGRRIAEKILVRKETVSCR